MVEPAPLLEFDVTSIPYDGDYEPAAATRSTTNFANFARDPATRSAHIRTFLATVNRDLNRLLDGDPESTRFAIDLDIVSISGRVRGRPWSAPFPLTEFMRATVTDTQTGAALEGPTGMNFSSYLRDYDFRVVFPQLIADQAPDDAWAGFGRLHGILTRMQFGREGVIPQSLTVAISIAQNHEYQATEFVHPVLGREYGAAQDSATDAYFRQMGMVPRFFRPAGLPAPLAMYSDGSLSERSDAFLAALVAVMGNFQRIYRPEIYLSRAAFSETPGQWCRASLLNSHYDRPPIEYDRDERELLADQQADRIEALFLRPHRDVVEQLTTLDLEQIAR